MLVVTLRPHGNAYGPVWERGEDLKMRLREGEVYSKREHDAYRHPDPQQLIDDGVLAAAGPLDLDGNGAAGGSPPAPARARRPRKPKA